MNRRSFSTTLLSLSVLASVELLGSRVAAAEPAPSATEDGSTLLVLGEDEDAWLHDHCAYRGLVTGRTNFPAPGAVFVLVEESYGVTTAKQFRCVEQPPFWKTTWIGASEADLACADAKSSGECTPPLAGDRPALRPPADRSAAPEAPEAPVAREARSDARSSSSDASSPRTSVSDVKRPVAAPAKSGGSTIGWVLVGTGITALVGAGIAGGLVLDAKATTSEHCTAVMTCNAQGLAAADRGQTLGLVATVAFGVGAAALTGGIVLLVVDKPKEKQIGISARSTTQGAALSLEGRF